MKTIYIAAIVILVFIVYTNCNSRVTHESDAKLFSQSDSVLSSPFPSGSIRYMINLRKQMYYEFFDNGSIRCYGAFEFKDKLRSRTIPDSVHLVLDSFCPIKEWRYYDSFGKMIYVGLLLCERANSVDSCIFDDGFGEFFYSSDFKRMYE